MNHIQQLPSNIWQSFPIQYIQTSASNLTETVKQIVLPIIQSMGSSFSSFLGNSQAALTSATNASLNHLAKLGPYAGPAAAIVAIASVAAYSLHATGCVSYISNQASAYLSPVAPQSEAQNAIDQGSLNDVAEDVQPSTQASNTRWEGWMEGAQKFVSGFFE